jgi:DNA-binding NtrC family response regulator
MWTIASTNYAQYRGRILVVDQDDWCREFLSQVIKLCGFGEFHLASSAEEANTLLEQLSFDLIITDLNKPLSLDEMARKIREAIHSKQRHKVEEDILRLKRDAFRF